VKQTAPEREAAMRRLAWRHLALHAGTSGLDLYRSDHYDMWHNVAIPSGIVNHFL
jgi:hypothetical protein